MSAVAT
jgi:hypothetical protein